MQGLGVGAGGGFSCEEGLETNAIVKSKAEEEEGPSKRRSRKVPDLIPRHVHVK